MNRCPQCHSPKLPHRVCQTCGYYKGRQAIDLTPKSDKSDKSAAS